MDLNKLLIEGSSNLKSAMNKIDRNGLGVLFIVNSDGKMIGLVSDGDIRRQLIKKDDLSIKIETFMNTDFKSMLFNSDSKDILSALDENTKIIPLLDNDGIIVDYANIERLKRIPIASPDLTGKELMYVSDCINSNWISSTGKYVEKFESNFSVYHNGMYSIATSNGTAALHLSLMGLGVNANDEVILPNLTFAATINSIRYVGATPVLVDIDSETLNIDPDLLEESITSKTKAIVVVHLYGQPCDMEKIVAIAQKHNLLLIEDCAEALGSKIKNRPVGVFGDAATFSFFGNKTITTGEGGMVLFKSKKAAKMAAELRDHGMSKSKRYWHNHVGYNYRLTNIQAAIGVAQFERLELFVDKKISIANRYSSLLCQYPFIMIPKEKINVKNSYWLYTLIINKNSPFKRSEMMSYLQKNGIEARKIFYPLDIMPPYEGFSRKELPVSNSISKSGISLPTSFNMSEVDITHIIDKLSEFLKIYK